MSHDHTPGDRPPEETDGAARLLEWKQAVRPRHVLLRFEGMRKPDDCVVLLMREGGGVFTTVLDGGPPTHAKLQGDRTLVFIELASGEGRVNFRGSRMKSGEDLHPGRGGMRVTLPRDLCDHVTTFGYCSGDAFGPGGHIA